MALSPRVLLARVGFRREGGEELLVGQRRPGLVGVERLDVDMAGAGRPVLVDPPADRRRVAPGDHRVDRA